MMRHRSAASRWIPPALAVAWLAAACSPRTPAASTAEIPHFDDLVAAVESGSTEKLVSLVDFRSLPCTMQEGLGGPPQCLPDEVEGTLVEVVPFIGPEGHHIRRSVLETWPGIGEAHLYAAFRTSNSTFTSEEYPAGDYGVAFLLEDQVTVVVFRITEGGIVRVDYTFVDDMNDVLEDSEVLLGPNPPSG